MNRSPGQGTSANLPLAGLGAVASTVDQEFLSWARDRQRRQRLHGAELAQITRHPDPSEGRSALAQQQAWAVRRSHERHLHDSAMAQLRHR